MCLQPLSHAYIKLLIPTSKHVRISANFAKTGFCTAFWQGFALVQRPAYSVAENTLGYLSIGIEIIRSATCSPSQMRGGVQEIMLRKDGYA